MTEALPTPCDGCDKPLQKTEQRQFRGMTLCASCYISENAALASITPAAVATLQPPSKNSKVFSPLAVQQSLTVRFQEFISMNHMEFFNQEISEVKDLSIEELRARIEEMAEAYFGAEAEAIRKKTKLQAASQVFNDKSTKMTAEERDALRIRDASYAPVLANPLKTRTPKQPKADKAPSASAVNKKKSLEDGLAALFGDKAEEALKKLLGS